jgi:hypothetical protein
MLRFNESAGSEGRQKCNPLYTNRSIKKEERVKGGPSDASEQGWIAVELTTKNS